MSRFVFTAAVICAAPAYAETAYFAAIPDLPVAPGLVEGAEPLASLFSGASGDLVLAQARGASSPSSVTRFYAESLSALGWAYEPSSAGQTDVVYQRGRERLILHVEPEGAGTYLRVRLVVRPASMNAD